MASLFSSLALRPSNAPSRVSNWVCQSCRHKSTFRRTRKALRVKPDPSFLPSKTEPQDHIIFNPPSSAPNVYHTPLKFLPKGDPRRKFHSAASPQPPPSASDTPSPIVEEAPQTTLASIASTRTRLPPPVRPRHEKKYHLAEPEIEEMRRLRAEDPRQWTRIRLAEKFECSQFFVSLCCSAPGMKAEMEERAEAARAKWGRRKREAREDRVTRRNLWGTEG